MGQRHSQSENPSGRNEKKFKEKLAENVSKLVSSIPFIPSEIGFGLTLLRQQDTSKSLVFSPLCISFGLSLVHAASKGETREQIRETLLNGSSDKQLEKHFSKISTALLKSINETEVNAANHVFCKKGHSIKKPYLDAVKKLYNAGATSLDFSDKEKSAETINKYVSDCTKEHIKELISSDMIEKNLYSILVTALYFKSDWLYKFDKSYTREKDFYGSESSKRSIDFLCQTDDFRYAENDQFQVVKLLYRDESFSMNIFLPKTRFGLKKALNKLTSETVQHLLAKCQERLTSVIIPRWKIESTMELSEILQNIGIKNAFDPTKADFGNMNDKTSCLTKIMHKALIEVDEDGTTAAAAMMEIRGWGLPTDIIDFIADHPFMFMLTKDAHPLFVGLHY